MKYFRIKAPELLLKYCRRKAYFLVTSVIMVLIYYNSSKIINYSIAFFSLFKYFGLKTLKFMYKFHEFAMITDDSCSLFF